MEGSRGEFKWTGSNINRRDIRVRKLSEIFWQIFYSKEQVQHRLRSGCRISERRRLEAVIGKDMMMSV